MGAVHHLLELWALQQSQQGRQGSLELYQLLVNSREADGKVIQEIPELRVEELHKCLICKGEDKEGESLSMDQDKIFQTRYHYASCFYDTGVYYAKYSPGRYSMIFFYCNISSPLFGIFVEHLIFQNLRTCWRTGVLGTCLVGK